MMEYDNLLLKVKSEKGKNIHRISKTTFVLLLL